MTDSSSEPDGDDSEQDSDEPQNRTLDTYGIKPTRPDPPVIHCRKWIPHPAYGSKKVGTLGKVLNRDIPCGLFLHRRHDMERNNVVVRKKTWNEEFGGYAISISALDVLEAYGASRLFIAVTDIGEVYEYSVGQYRAGRRFEWRRNDPQRAVGKPAETARWTYDGSEVSIIDPGKVGPMDTTMKHGAGSGTSSFE